MRLHAHYSMVDAGHFKSWHPAALSIVLHLMVLAFLPALLVDLSIKKLHDKKKSIIHLVEVPKKLEVQPRIEPKVEPKIEPKVKPIQKEQILPQPLKREVAPPEPRIVSSVVNPPVPQPASAMMAKPLAHATVVEMQARTVPVAPSDAVSSAPAAKPSARWVAGNSGKVDISSSQFQPKAISENPGNVAVASSRRTATVGIAPELFAAKPLSPTLIEETQVAKEDLQGIENGFAGLIRERIAAAKAYPTASRQAGHEGKVLVAFVLSKDGQVLDVSVQRTSNHERLDEAAVEAVKKAAPFPPIPEKIKRDSMSFKLPISFNLR